MAFVANDLYSAGGRGGHTLYMYSTSADTFATVATAGYFNNTDDNIELKAGDRLFIEASDVSGILRVSSVTSGSVTCVESLDAVKCTGLHIGTAGSETEVTATAAEINEAADKSAAAVVAATADVTLTQATHAGKVVTLGSATGDTATLPAATGTGDVYKIVVAVTVTSNSHIIQVANATDEFVGVVMQVDADTSDALVAYPALDADGFDTITMDGSTTGGIQGDYYVITDIAAGKFLLEGYQSGTGTVATPLSAAVS